MVSDRFPEIRLPSSFGGKAALSFAGIVGCDAAGADVSRRSANGAIRYKFHGPSGVSSPRAQGSVCEPSDGVSAIS